MTLAQPSKASGSDSENLKKRFLAAAVELSEIGAHANYRVVPTRDKRLPLFGALSYESQLSAVLRLEKICSIHRALISEGKDIRNSLSILWVMFRELGLTPPSNLFDKIAEDDVLEVYLDEGLQIFANFRFFELCSYSVEQIYSVPWMELWHREDADLQAMKELVARTVQSTELSAVLVTDFSHLVTEKDSPFGYVLDYRVKAIAPLVDRSTHRKAGVIIIEQGFILNELSPEQEQLRLLEFCGHSSVTADNPISPMRLYVPPTAP